MASRSSSSSSQHSLRPRGAETAVRAPSEKKQKNTDEVKSSGRRVDETASIAHRKGVKG